MQIGIEKNRKEIIYGIKQTVGVGLMNGDRYTTMARRIAEQVDGDYTKAIRIARTEAHRTREAGNADAAERVDAELQGTQTGLRMTKTWRTMKDERVRPQRVRRKKGGWSKSMGKGPNHMILDGQTVLADEPFDLQDGNTAMSPGQSGVAGHDINCRCFCSYAMMTDAEYFAKTGKHFPGWKDAGKSAETVENSGENGIIESRNFAQRTMANGQRTSPHHILTKSEIDSVLADADSLGVPRSLLRFNAKSQTGFYEDDGVIYIRGDILPDLRSLALRDNLTQKAVLAHEYYGHYMSNPSNYRVGDWRDEFRASYNAAVNALNLSDDERRMLMLDAYDRAKEAGVTVKYNKKARELIYGYE